MKILRVGIQATGSLCSMVAEHVLLIEANHNIDKLVEMLLDYTKLVGGNSTELYRLLQPVNRILKLEKHYTKILYLELLNLKYKTYRVVVYVGDNFDCAEILKIINESSEYASKIAHVSEISTYARIE